MDELVCGLAEWRDLDEETSDEVRYAVAALGPGGVDAAADVD